MERLDVDDEVGKSPSFDQGQGAAYRRLLRLTTTRRVLAYRELAEALGVENRAALLAFLVAAMEDGVVFGTLDSEQEVFRVQAINPGSRVEAGQFWSLQQRLERWEERVQQVLAALEDAQQACAQLVKDFEMRSALLREPSSFSISESTEIVRNAENIHSSPVDSDMDAA